MSRAPLVFNTALLLPTTPADQEATPPSASCFDSPRSQHPPLPIGSPASLSGSVVATRPLGANSSFAADARSPRSPRIVSPRTAEEAINFDCTQIRWFLRSEYFCLRVLDFVRSRVFSAVALHHDQVVVTKKYNAVYSPPPKINAVSQLLVEQGVCMLGKTF